MKIGDYLFSVAIDRCIYLFVSSIFNSVLIFPWYSELLAFDFSCGPCLLLGQSLGDNLHCTCCEAGPC